MLITNAFSLNMLANPDGLAVDFIGLTPDKARGLVSAGGVESAIGHTDTAAVVSSVLGISIPMNRTTVSLGEGNCFVVAQYVGPRLPEGTTSLPEGSRIDFFLVTVTRKG
jgi:hypothetical protein